VGDVIIVTMLEAVGDLDPFPGILATGHELVECFGLVGFPFGELAPLIRDEIKEDTKLSLDCLVE
jgi:hypothetical protein